MRKQLQFPTKAAAAARNHQAAVKAGLPLRHNSITRTVWPMMQDEDGKGWRLLMSGRTDRLLEESDNPKPMSDTTTEGEEVVR